MAIKGFSKVNDYITMLGTGNALATRCYNTCFTRHAVSYGPRKGLRVRKATGWQVCDRHDDRGMNRQNNLNLADQRRD